MKNFKLLCQLLFRCSFLFLCFIPIFLILIFVVASCKTTKNSTFEQQRIEMISDNDGTEYSIIILDPGYES